MVCAKRMKPFYYRLALFLALLLCWLPAGWAWISQKCLMLDVMTSYSPFAVTLKCPWNGLTAACDQVTNVSLDLSRIPRGVETICLTGKEGLVLQPNAFSRFQHLMRLYIDGGVAAILPGALGGLSTLHALSLASPNQIHLALTSEVLQDLTGLEELTVTNYALAAMTTNVFARLGQLRSLKVTSDDVDFSAVVCRLLRVNATLTTLQMTMVNMTLLKTPNCLTNLSAFPLLQNVSLVLPNITAIETGALQCFKRITNICVPLEEPILLQLLQSGIQSIDSMDISLRDLNVESLCEMVLSFAVTKLAVTCLTLRAYPNLAWAKCQSLQYISLQLEQPSGSVISLSFIHALRNVTWLYVDAGDGSADFSTLCPPQTSFTQLRFLSYSTVEALVLQANQLTCLHFLEELEICVDGTHIQTDYLAFEGLYNLQELSIVVIADEEHLSKMVSFRGLQRVQTIQVKKVMPAVIESNYIGNLTNLINFIGSFSNTTTIDDFAFKSLSKLQHLDLSGNRISTIQANSFAGLCNLQILLLGWNPIKRIEATAFSHFPSLSLLRLKYCASVDPNSQVLNLSALFGKFPHHLTEVSISSTSLHPINFIVTDDSTPDLNLTLNLIGKSIGLFGCDRPFFKSVTKLKVATDSFTCGGHGSSSSSAFRHFSSVEWLKIGQWTRSTVQDLSGLGGLVHLRELGFENVNLDNSTGFTTALRNLTRLEKLSLVECWLDSLQASTSVNLQSLKFLGLLIDGSNGVTESFFEPLTSLKLVILGQQHLRCDCESAGFEEWARRQSDVEVFLSHYQQESLQCEVGGKSQDLRSFGEKHCRPYLGFMLFIITATLNLLFMLVVLLQHLAREYLLALFHIAGGWVNEVLRHHDGPRGRYDYDAFVSYSGRDERWVVDRLLPALEQRGPPLLRLCLHSRDFQPGKDVVQNITDSLYRSRRTLCLVSRHFLRSGWCSLEMRLATQRLQVEHRDVLILVFLEAVPSHLLSAHHRLARLVKTRTYIQWPQEPVQQEAFWDRLWAKLASERR